MTERSSGWVVGSIDARNFVFFFSSELRDPPEDTALSPKPLLPLLGVA